MKKLKLLLLLLIVSFTAYTKEISFSPEELTQAGEKIFYNETGGRRDALIHWNIGEEFASLGIGHFIWYPADFDGPFDESFPSLLTYYREQDISLPELFEDNEVCPWNSIEEFEAAKGNKEIEEAIDFLEGTKDIQTAFIYERLQRALDGILDATDKKDHVRKQFYRVADSSGGLYPLIDYVNFKGEGIKTTERYKGQGWGLLQILENMTGDEPGPEALKEFARQAKFVLARRVENSPVERGEKRWIPGWNKRIESYTNY